MKGPPRLHYLRRSAGSARWLTASASRGAVRPVGGASRAAAGQARAALHCAVRPSTPVAEVSAQGVGPPVGPRPVARTPAMELSSPADMVDPPRSPCVRGECISLAVTAD